MAMAINDFFFREWGECDGVAETLLESLVPWTKRNRRGPIGLVLSRADYEDLEADLAGRCVRETRGGDRECIVVTGPLGQVRVFGALD